MISKKDLSVIKEKHRILLLANEFICLRPHPHLREYVANYNITFPSSTLMPAGFTLVPCGCATLTVSSSSKGLSFDLEGATTKPHIVLSQEDQPEMTITIEFKPAGLYVFTGISQNELTDRALPFDALSPAFAKSLAETVEKAESIDALVANLDALLLANMRTAYRPELMMALQDIKTYAGNISIKQLSDSAHYSERQLNRIFNQFVGINAKSFSRLIRINHTFRLLQKTNKSLAYVSDVSGFHDLPHFIHDFKLVSGVTPQEYRNNMSDFYNNPTRF